MKAIEGLSRGTQHGDLRSPALETVLGVVLAQAKSVVWQSSSPLSFLTGAEPGCMTQAGSVVHVDLRVEGQSSPFEDALAETNRLYGGMLRRLA
jgi:hypothetical protein